MKANITKTLLDKVKPNAKPYEIRDVKTSGFLVRVQPSGKKSFYCEYMRGGRLRIGDVNIWGVSKAREHAKEIIVEYQKTGSVEVFKNPSTERLTYIQYLERHYFEWVDSNHKSACKTKRRLLNDCTRFHKTYLDAITPQMVEKWRTQKVLKGNSPHTANRCFAYLRASLSKAVEWGFLEDHPLRRMKLIRAASNMKVRFLSKDEEARLRAAMLEREMEKKRLNPTINLEDFADHLMPMVLLSMNLGLRLGELLSLRWEAVDFTGKRLTITAEDAKSKKARYIPLNMEAFCILTRWRKRSSLSNCFVFTNKEGRPFKSVKTGWGALLKRASVDNFRWHDLRHHFASRLAMAGVDLNTIREILGHSSYSVTLRYAHLSEDHKAAAVALLD